MERGTKVLKLGLMRKVDNVDRNLISLWKCGQKHFKKFALQKRNIKLVIPKSKNTVKKNTFLQ